MEELMSDPQKVYYVVQQFLACRGYDERKRTEGVEDGHMILHYVQVAQQSACTCNPAGDCVSVTFERLFALLEQGCYLSGEPLAPGESVWGRQDTNQALAVGGFAPWETEEY